MAYETMLVLGPPALFLAGAICFAGSVVTEYPSRRRRWRLMTETLWGAGGLIALSSVAITIVRLSTAPTSRPAIGDGVADIAAFGFTTAWAAIGLLNIALLWRRVRRRGRPAHGHRATP